MPLTIKQVIRVIQSEIMRDIKAGVVPQTVKSFDGLSDWTNSHWYGRSKDTEHLTEEHWDAIEGAVDAWLYNGRR